MDLMPRPRLTFANVASALALFVALGGAALAASSIVAGDGTISACYSKRNGAVRLVKKGHKCKASEKSVAWNQKGSRGLAGAAGKDGAKGTSGTNGTNGSNGTNGTNGTNGFGATWGAAPTGAAATRFAPPNGAGTVSGTESGTGVIALSPNRTITLSEFAARLDGPLGGGATATITLRVNVADSTISCAIVDPATSCTSSNSVSIPARTPFDIRIVSTGGAAVGIGWSYTLT
jgi:hypothetical protein